MIMLEVWTAKDGYTIAVNEDDPIDLTLDEYDWLIEALQDYRDKPDGYYKRHIKEDQDAE